MTESQFNELRDYYGAEGSCIDKGYRPLASLISHGWLHEVVRDCWMITDAGREAFLAVVEGRADIRADRQDAA